MANSTMIGVQSEEDILAEIATAFSPPRFTTGWLAGVAAATTLLYVAATARHRYALAHGIEEPEPSEEEAAVADQQRLLKLPGLPDPSQGFGTEPGSVASAVAAAAFPHAHGTSVEYDGADGDEEVGMLHRVVAAQRALGAP